MQWIVQTSKNLINPDAPEQDVHDFNGCLAKYYQLVYGDLNYLCSELNYFNASLFPSIKIISNKKQVIQEANSELEVLKMEEGGAGKRGMGR